MKAPRKYATPGCKSRPRSLAFKADRWCITVSLRMGESAGNAMQEPKLPPSRAEARGGGGSAITLLVPKHFYTRG